MNYSNTLLRNGPLATNPSSPTLLRGLPVLRSEVRSRRRSLDPLTGRETEMDRQEPSPLSKVGTSSHNY